MDMEVLIEWIGRMLGKVFGTQNERAIRRYWKLVRELHLQRPHFVRRDAAAD